MYRSALATEPKPGACDVSGIHPQLPSSEEVYILDVWAKMGLADLGSPGVALWHPGRACSLALTGLYSPLPLACGEETYRGLVPFVHVWARAR